MLKGSFERTSRVLEMVLIDRKRFFFHFEDPLSEESREAATAAAGRALRELAAVEFGHLEKYWLTLKLKSKLK